MTLSISAQKVLDLYPLLPTSIKNYVTHSSVIVELHGHLNAVLSIDDKYILRTKKIELYDFDDVGSCGNFKAAVDYVDKSNFKLHPAGIILEESRSNSFIVEYLLYEKNNGITLEKYAQNQNDSEIEKIIRQVAVTMNQLHHIKAPTYGFFKGQQFNTWNEFIHYWIDKQSKYIHNNKTLTDSEIAQVKSIFNKYDYLFSIQEPSTIHLDLNYTNILIGPHGTIASIIDWDNARGGDPIADISYTIERVYNRGSLKRFSPYFLDEYMKISHMQNNEIFILKYRLYSLFYAFKLLPVHSTHTTQNENIKDLVQYVRKMLTQFTE